MCRSNGHIYSRQTFYHISLCHIYVVTLQRHDKVKATFLTTDFGRLIGTKKIPVTLHHLEKFAFQVALIEVS